MSAWTWVLVALCALGVVLALVPTIAAAGLALRTKRRIEALRQSRLALSLQSLALQAERFSRISADAATLGPRAQKAVASMRTSAAQLRLADAQQSLGHTGAELESLARDLR